MIKQPLRGLVGQAMTGARSLGLGVAAVPINLTTGSGAISVRKNGWALIYMWGAGGGGNVDPGLNSQVCGGSGAGALYKLVPVRAGDQLTYAVGAGVLTADGGDSTVLLQNGQTLTAGGGKAGNGSTSSVQSLGGVATGGDINRRGGVSGASNTGIQFGSPGDGPGGGTGAAGGGNSGGGGGAAGMADILTDFTGGNGAAANTGGSTGGAPGGGAGAGGASGGAGGAGKIIIVLVTSN